MGAPYKLFFVMHLLKRTLIHQKILSTVSWINNSNVKILEKSCLGDFNASSSTTWHNLFLWENRIIENLVVNDNSLRFHKFFNSRCWSLLNTWFSYKKSGRITCHSPDQVNKKVYDFILACSWLSQYVSNFPVWNSCDFDFDHQLVIADVCTLCTKVARYVKWAAISAKEHINLNYVKQPAISEWFVNTTLKKLENLNPNSTNSVMNDRLISSINSATEETLPLREKTWLYQPWHDDVILKEPYDLKDRKINSCPSGTSAEV